MKFNMVHYAVGVFFQGFLYLACLSHDTGLLIAIVLPVAVVTILSQIFFPIFEQKD